MIRNVEALPVNLCVDDFDERRLTYEMAMSAIGLLDKEYFSTLTDLQKVEVLTACGVKIDLQSLGNKLNQYGSQPDLDQLDVDKLNLDQFDVDKLLEEANSKAAAQMAALWKSIFS